MLSIDQQRRLLRLARVSLEAHVCQLPEPEVDSAFVVEIRAGAFVSIFRHGDLRGCLGRLTSALPLTHLIPQLSRAVVDSDPRFETVQPVELPEITMEISVLSPTRAIGSVTEIEIGRHGLIVEEGSRRGLLLPQVAGKEGWGPEAFATHTSLKAGLGSDAWRRGARMSVFEALVFGEEDDPDRLLSPVSSLR
jgi:AmmeMemoRadiSam system protein A